MPIGIGKRFISDPGIATMRAKPARMSLANIATAETKEAFFNPTELSEKLVVNYNRLKILGLSHEPLQYQNTGNHMLDPELAFRVYADNSNRLDDMDDFRRFLLSLCYPRRSSPDILGGAPPRVLFMWPGLASLQAKIVSLDFKHTMFDLSGKPTHSAAKIGIEEIRDFRLTSEEVRANGTRRSGVSRATGGT